MERLTCCVFSSLLRTFALISLILLLGCFSAIGQIACPAMAITQVNVNKGQRLSGFSSVVRQGRRNAQMGDFFTGKKQKHFGYSGKDPFSFKTKKSGVAKEYSEFSTRTKRSGLFRDKDEFSSKGRGKGSYFDKDEFASRSSKKRRFRSYDEFATRAKRSKQFRDFDEFAYRRSSRSSFHDKDEFASRSNRTRKVNIDAQFAVRTTDKRFSKGRYQKDEFNSKQKRTKQAKSEYTPFASSTSPAAAEKTHREPQMGLWGGTIGRRSGQDSRAETPLPDLSKKKED